MPAQATFFEFKKCKYEKRNEYKHERKIKEK